MIKTRTLKVKIVKNEEILMLTTIIIYNNNDNNDNQNLQSYKTIESVKKNKSVLRKSDLVI